MFKRPKMKEVAAVDPSDLENRRESERRKRLATGGRQSTLLATAMERAAAKPTATLTGVNG
jgi:hypothetical protein